MADMNSVSVKSRVRPVLKWAGGKGLLLSALLNRIPETFTSYHEPFVGGGALFFELASQERISNAYLSDINNSLIDVYLALRECVDEVIPLLHHHKNNHSHDYFYSIRATQPAELTLPERAAQSRRPASHR